MRQDSAVERGANEIGVNCSRVVEISLAQLGIMKVCPVEAGMRQAHAPERSVAEISVAESRAVQVRAIEVSTGQQCTAEVSTLKVSLSEVDAVKIRTTQIDYGSPTRTGEIGHEDSQRLFYVGGGRGSALRHHPGMLYPGRRVAAADVLRQLPLYFPPLSYRVIGGALQRGYGGELSCRIGRLEATQRRAELTVSLELNLGLSGPFACMIAVQLACGYQAGNCGNG